MISTKKYLETNFYCQFPTLIRVFRCFFQNESSEEKNIKLYLFSNIFFKHLVLEYRNRYMELWGGWGSAGLVGARTPWGGKCSPQKEAQFTPLFL